MDDIEEWEPLLNEKLPPDLRGAILIGVGWTVQMIDVAIPADPWDIPLDGFASPEGVTMWR